MTNHDTETPSVDLNGTYTDARIMGLTDDDVEEDLREQIQTFIDHQAFTEPVRMMPDTHVGKGCAIGFTMPLNNRVVPNSVGVDVGCGMYSIALSYILDDYDEDDLLDLDAEIREKIPMGFDVHRDTDYHLGDDFPWSACEAKLESLRQTIGQDIDPEWFDKYGLEYFVELCERVDYDPKRTIDSVGTLGGGNHFLEIGKSERCGDYWLTVHSGSRGIGLHIAKYWQAKAGEYQEAKSALSAINADPTIEDTDAGVVVDVLDYVKFDEDDSVQDVRRWLTGGKGEHFIKKEKVRADFEGPEIDVVMNILNGLRPDHDRNKDLDYLEGEAAWGYYVDMVFAQTYASISRRRMAYAVELILGVIAPDSIESVHNYIDFDDGVLRKGACSARKGERILVPLNMRDGTLICRGKGNDEWNQSSPHGAGRVMSRTKAFNELDMDDFEDQMEGIASTSVLPSTLDEAPGAYKDSELIGKAIGDTAIVVDRLIPVLNIKAT